MPLEHSAQFSRPTTRAWLLPLFIMFCCVYGAVQNVGYFDSSDSANRFKMMMSLVTTGSPNWTVEGSDKPQFCANSIGPAIAALPFEFLGYAVQKSGLSNYPLEQVLIRWTMISSIFYSSLFMCLLARLVTAIGYTSRAGIVISLIAGFATLIFPYSKSVQGENLVGACLTAITLLILKNSKKPQLRYSLFLGAIYGFLLTVKNELGLILPLLLLSITGLHKLLSWNRFHIYWKMVAVFFAGLIPGVIVILLYNYLRFGDALTTGLVGYNNNDSLKKSFAYPFWQGLYLQFFSPGKGIVWYCPILLASLPLIYKFLKAAPRPLLVPYLWWAIMTALYSKWFSPAGDTALGARFQVSYMGFAVLPLLAMPVGAGALRSLYKGWAGLFLAVSVLLQILFCIVSFNIDFHKQIFSVQGALQQYLHVVDMYFIPRQSLLLGFFRTLNDGYLDMYYVRLRPLEGALTVLPGIWWLLALAACTLGIAYYQTRPAPTETTGTTARPFNYLFPYQIPAMCLALAAILRVGYPAHQGLQLSLTHPDQASHKTIVQDIAIDNLNNGREVYKVLTPVAMRWSGKMYCDAPGDYTMNINANQPMKITLGQQKQTVNAAPDPATSGSVTFSVPEKGWQRLDIRTTATTMIDKFYVTVKPPSQRAPRSLRAQGLKH